MHYRYAADIVGRVKALFNREPTVQEITVPENHKLTVVGDTHGQLQDLFTIFTINGLPSESNMVRPTSTPAPRLPAAPVPLIRPLPRPSTSSTETSSTGGPTAWRFCSPFLRTSCSSPNSCS